MQIWIENEPHALNTNGNFTYTNALSVEITYFPTNILEKNDLVVAKISQSLEHDLLDIIHEVELKLLQTHHIGGNSM